MNLVELVGQLYLYTNTLIDFNPSRILRIALCFDLQQGNFY